MDTIVPTDSVRVLVVDDEAGLRRSLARILGARGFTVTTAEDGEQAVEAVDKSEPDVVLVDLMMPKMGGMQVLDHVKKVRPRVEVIVMTAHGDVDTAVSAVKKGAWDFLTKPFASNEAVVLAVSKAAEHQRLIQRTQHLEERLVAEQRFGGLIGTSRKMQEVYRRITGVSAATSSVLILGESGTGKELVARAIHLSSMRAQKPFVPVNCAAIPKELVESELFGHVKGAFTGAQTARVGLFESANTGTIFLDEVGDLPLAAQVKLLRTLAEGEVKPVGSNDMRLVDVRVLAATNVDLKTKIAEGSFRSDLYYRLNVIPVFLPPLRDRDEDVVLLTHHIVQKLAHRMERPVKRISADAMAAIRAYRWPGNVRELEHALEHAFVLAQGDELRARDLPFIESPTSIAPPPRAASRVEATPESSDDDHDDNDETDDAGGEAGESGEGGGAALELPREFTELYTLKYADAKRRAMAAFDTAYVTDVLVRSEGNYSKAARHAGMDRSNFRRIVKKRKRPS